VDITTNLLLGVIGGIVSAAILFLVRVLVFRHFLPWYQDLVYRGIIVSGEWYACEFALSQHIRMRIAQSAGKITGSAWLTFHEEDPDHTTQEIREFSVAGEIQDRYLTLTLSNVNRSRIGLVTLLLQPMADGRQLAGMMSFISIRGSNIDAIDVRFSREFAVAKQWYSEDKAAAEKEARVARLAKPRRTKAENLKEAQFTKPQSGDGLAAFIVDKGEGG
jgi:hypothetical protein